MAEISDTEEDSKRPPDFDWNSDWWWNSSDDDVGYESPDLDQTLHMVLRVKNRTHEQEKRGCQRYVEKVGAFVRVWIGDYVDDYRTVVRQTANTTHAMTFALVFWEHIDPLFFFVSRKNVCFL